MNNLTQYEIELAFRKMHKQEGNNETPNTRKDSTTRIPEVSKKPRTKTSIKEEEN